MSGPSKQMSERCEQTDGRASGPVLTTRFLAVVSLRVTSLRVGGTLASEDQVERLHFREDEFGLRGGDSQRATKTTHVQMLGRGEEHESGLNKGDNAGDGERAAQTTHVEMLGRGERHESGLNKGDNAGGGERATKTADVEMLGRGKRHESRLNKGDNAGGGERATKTADVEMLGRGKY